MKTAPNREARGSAEVAFAADLKELADLFGVESSFVNTAGRRQVASTDAVLAVLRALGAEVDGSGDAPRDVSRALLAEQLRRHRQILEPVIVSSVGTRPVVDLSLPRGLHPSDCWLTLEREDRTVHRSRLLPLISHPLGVVTVNGERMDRYEATLSVRSHAELPPGYHRVRLEGPRIAAESLLIVSPRCPEPARGWGAFLPVHALRTDHDWGVGTFGDLAQLAQWVGGLGASFLGTLPLYPALLDGDIEEPSPYLPASRLGWNELYVDPLALPELAQCPDVIELLGSSQVASELAALRHATTVDYPAVMALIRQVLQPMAQAVFAGPSSRRSELETFARQNPQLVAYARFRAGQAAPAGPDSADPEPPSTDPPASAHRPPTDIDSLQDDASRYHLYVQWVAEQQLAVTGGRLYLDLPIGVHPQGFDPWWEPRAFVSGVEGGAPPDHFFEGGQQWGFQPLDPRGIREDHYRYPIACLRHVMRHAHTVRLDHVMGLQRLYWVPAGLGATEGVYVRYQHEEMRAIVGVEAHRSNTAVVGEDLGTVPESVREAMGHDHMLRSWVLQFAAEPEDPLPAASEWSLASLGTHDLPRFATYWEGGDIEERASAGQESPAWAAEEQSRRSHWRRAVARHLDNCAICATADTDDLRTAVALQICLDHLAAGPSKLMLVDLEDLAGERRPENRPGTGPEAANWQNRAKFTLAELQADEQAVASLQKIDHLRRTWSLDPGTETMRQIEEVHR